MRVKVAATAIALGLVMSACSGDGDGARRPAAAASERTTTSSSPASTTTVPSTTTSTAVPKPTAPPPPPGLVRGSRGEAVMALERRLTELKFDTGPVDGVFDGATQHAVLSFQKTYGLGRTGRATQDVIDRMATAGHPDAMVPGGGATKVEVDLKRQVLFLWKGGELMRIIGVSTGNGKRYCVDGECAVAVTPGGSFRVTRRISGWRESRLGKLYNPLYFNGGIAIHGAPSVPAYPASHGCVRIPMYVAGWFPGAVPNGTPVYVIGGPRAPVPFNEPAPGEATTTTTTTSASPGESTTTTTGSTSTTTESSTTTSTAPPPTSSPSLP